MRKGGIAFLENFTLESLAIIDFEKTGESPGDAVNEIELEHLLVNWLLPLGVGKEDSGKKSQQLRNSNNHGTGHHVEVTLLESNKKVWFFDVFGHK